MCNGYLRRIRIFWGRSRRESIIRTPFPKGGGSKFLKAFEGIHFGAARNRSAPNGREEALSLYFQQPAHAAVHSNEGHRRRTNWPCRHSRSRLGGLAPSGRRRLFGNPATFCATQLFRPYPSPNYAAGPPALTSAGVFPRYFALSALTTQADANRLFHNIPRYRGEIMIPGRSRPFSHAPLSHPADSRELPPNSN